MAGEVSVGFYVPTHSTFVLVYPRDSSSMHTNKILCNTYHNGMKFFWRNIITYFFYTYRRVLIKSTHFGCKQPKRRFSQKMKKQICFVRFFSFSQQTKQIRSFIFWENLRCFNPAFAFI